MEMINRDDMLELTRRMTLKRNCFDRIAGAYFDEEGYVDGSFNTHFLKLEPKERSRKLAIAKQIPFAETNEQLTVHRFRDSDMSKGTIWQLLMALRECELKNDALLELFYESFGAVYRSNGPYAVFFYHGNYDIPNKGSDKAEQWESEEVYKFLICAVCPLHGEYEADDPECGFLFPAFSDRSADPAAIDIYQAFPQQPHTELVREILSLDNQS